MSTKTKAIPEIPYQPAPKAFCSQDDDERTTYDRLNTIFSGQMALMDRYHPIEERNGERMPTFADLGDLQSRTVQMRIHTLFGFLVRELGEAMQHMDAKPWKDNPRPVAGADFLEEIADSFHFFVEICLTAGISADELFDQYFRAWGKNRERQATGY